VSDFQTSRTVRARRARSCPECRQTIQVGERYSREAGRWDGDFYTAVMCRPCQEFADRYVSSMRVCSALNYDEVAYTFGSIIEEAAEFIGYTRPSGQPLPAVRDAVMALFDEFDEAERAYRARERDEARKAKAAAERYRQHITASRWMVRGMSACSAQPVEAA
jgi:hypothetical protein